MFRLAAFAVTLVCHATAQVANLRIQVIEGEGAVHAPGSRSGRPLTVAVTDDLGKPVEGAAVSFQLPDTGPGGTLGNGLRTDVAMTDALGRVSLRGLQVNRNAGRFAIRVVASKEQARAGIMASQYVGETAAASKGRAKWVVVAALIGGGAAAGILSAGRSAAAAPAASPVTPPVTAPATVTIGPPATTVGRP
jgi:hypothetical protein